LPGVLRHSPRPRSAGGLALLLVCLTCGIARADLLYPLRLPPVLSSNFGQYRQDHPHAGVDCWTHLQLGAPVLAVDDGTIYQARVSTGGYGRVLYQRLRDGRVAVYGHLGSFAPNIESLAGGVRRGDVIGYVGDSGTDVPHLHFELRDAGGVPVNPLTAGLPYRDTLPPVLDSLHLETLSATGQVNGRPREIFLPFAAQADGTYRAPAVTIRGHVGMALSAYDQTDDSPRRLAPYDIRLAVDGREVFAHRFARIDYGQSYASALSYDRRLVLAQRGYFIRLYRLYQRTLLHPTPLTGDLSRLAPGTHQATIVVTDEAGHATRGAFDLVVESAPPKREELSELFRRPASPVVLVDEPWVEWRAGYARVVGVGGTLNGQAPQIHARYLPNGVPIPSSDRQVDIDGRQFALLVPPPPPNARELQLELRWADAGGETVKQDLAFPFERLRNGRTVDFGPISLAAGQGVLFREVPVMMRAFTPPVPDWLAAVTPAYQIGDEWEPVKDKLQVTLRHPRGAAREQVGVYQYDDGTWWFLGAGDSAKAAGLGAFALMRDLEPPQVGEMWVGRGPTPTVKIVAWDRGSGLPNAGIDIRLDGEPQAVEHQPLKHQVVFDVPAPGPHDLEILLTDRSGNRTHVRRTFTTTTN
jgi:hypothetical protein